MASYAEEWTTSKRKVNHKTRQVETRVSRQLLVENGKVIADSGPQVITRIKEDNRVEECEQEKPPKVLHEALEDSDSSNAFGRVLGEKKEVQKVSREVREENMQYHDERFKELSGRDVHQKAIRAPHELITINPDSARRGKMVHYSNKGKVYKDTDEILEVAKLAPDGSITKEVKRTNKHEEYSEDEKPDEKGEADELRQKPVVQRSSRRHADYVNDFDDINPNKRSSSSAQARGREVEGADPAFPRYDIDPLLNSLHDEDYRPASNNGRPDSRSVKQHSIERRPRYKTAASSSSSDEDYRPTSGGGRRDSSSIKQHSIGQHSIERRPRSKSAASSSSSSSSAASSDDGHKSRPHKSSPGPRGQVEIPDEYRVNKQRLMASKTAGHHQSSSGTGAKRDKDRRDRSGATWTKDKPAQHDQSEGYQFESGAESADEADDESGKHAERPAADDKRQLDAISVSSLKGPNATIIKVPYRHVIEIQKVDGRARAAGPADRRKLSTGEQSQTNSSAGSSVIEKSSSGMSFHEDIERLSNRLANISNQANRRASIDGPEKHFEYKTVIANIEPMASKSVKQVITTYNARLEQHSPFQTNSNPNQTESTNNNSIQDFSPGEYYAKYRATPVLVDESNLLTGRKEHGDNDDRSSCCSLQSSRTYKIRTIESDEVEQPDNTEAAEAEAELDENGNRKLPAAWIFDPRDGSSTIIVPPERPETPKIDSKTEELAQSRGGRSYYLEILDDKRSKGLHKSTQQLNTLISQQEQNRDRVNSQEQVPTRRQLPFGGPVSRLGDKAKSSSCLLSVTKPSKYSIYGGFRKPDETKKPVPRLSYSRAIGPRSQRGDTQSKTPSRYLKMR